MTRESRLFKNMWHHMFKSGVAIVRSYLMFRPYVLLVTLGSIFGVLATIPFVRFGILWLFNEHPGHVQSLIFGTSMLVASLLCFALLIIADLQRTNRILLEESLERVKALQYPQHRLLDEVRPFVSTNGHPSPTPQPGYR